MAKGVSGSIEEHTKHPQPKFNVTSRNKTGPSTRQQLTGAVEKAWCRHFCVVSEQCRGDCICRL